MIWDFQHLLARRLLIWSILSIVAGVWLTTNLEGMWQGFGIQGIIWGLIDGVIGLFGLRRAQKRLHLHVNLEEVEREATSLRKILRINTGLDILYIAGGAGLLIFRGIQDEFAAGTGWGIILQGVFLFIFDLMHTLNIPSEYTLPDLGILEEPEHRASTLEGGKAAVLLVHGFPGTPAELRSLGEALNNKGWTVRMMCLPGHGSNYRTIFQTRATDWEQAVQEELAVLQVMHEPVLLAGYSLGAGLSIPAAAKLMPDGLILLAPFWMDERWWFKLFMFLARPFLPIAINPFKNLRVDTPQFRFAIEDIIPDFDFNTPHIQAAMRDFKLPVIFIEQFRLLSRWVRSSAKNIQNMPVLVVQAVEDNIIRKKSTQKLLSWMSGKPVYFEVPGDHNLNQQKHPGYALMEQAVLKFADQFETQPFEK